MGIHEVIDMDYTPEQTLEFITRSVMLEDIDDLANWREMSMWESERFIGWAALKVFGEDEV